MDATDDRVQLALDAAEMGSFVWYPDDDRGEPDARMLALFGLPRDSTLTLRDALSTLIHPADRERYAAGVARALDPAVGELREEIRVVRPDGAERWIAVTARVAFAGAPPRPTCMRGVALDVTARKRDEMAHRASEARYHALATASGDVIYRMSPDWSEMRQLDGRGFLSDTPEPSDRWLGRYIHPDDQPSVTAAIAAAVRTKGTFELEHRVVRADGTLGWTESRAVPVLDDAGEIVEWIGAAKDVTVRKAAEAALRESEERYRLIVERARDYAIFTTDPDGRIETWSPGAEGAFGWTAAEAIGQPMEMTFVPDDNARGEAEKERAVARTEGVAANIRWHQRRDGTRVFIEGSARAMRDAAGALRGFLKVGQDITRRHQTEEALRASEARFRTVVNLVPDLLWESDPDGSTPWYNDQWRLYTGQTVGEAAGWGWVDAIHPDDRAASTANYAAATRTGQMLQQMHRIRRADGAYRWFLVRAEPLRDERGRIVRWFGAATDVHEQRVALEAAERAQREIAVRVAERTAELAAANAQLAREAAERTELRRQLASAEEEERRRVARELHDQLGQHLTGLTLGIDAARRHAVGDAAALRVLGQLYDQTQTMARDVRTLTLALRPPELDDLGFESAVESYVREWAARSGVVAEVEVTGMRERGLSGEMRTTLYRIVQEALTNVARHAAATHVSVIVEKPDGEVRLIVEDDGRGFDIDAVAERVRVERRLGLVGMRERAALVGGTLSVESTPGGGTTVYVRIPSEEHA